MALTVAQAFDQFRSKLELTQTLQSAVSTHHQAVRDWIESVGLGYETKLIGSLQRRTRIQPRPKIDCLDIDILVVMGSFGNWVSPGGTTPRMAMDQLEHVVAGHGTYKRIGPEADAPTVSLEYQDSIKVELVPAYHDNIGYDLAGNPVSGKGRAYWIPKNNTWVYADYDYDAEYISAQNRACAGLLVPTIKLLKAAKRNSFQDMSSFYLEVLATQIVPQLAHSVTEFPAWTQAPALVSGFLLVASKRLAEAIALYGSASPFTDSHLTEQRKSYLAGWLETLHKLVHNGLTLTDSNLAIEGLNLVFGEPFSEHS